MADIGPDHRFSVPELLGLMHAHKIVHLKLGSMELTLHPSAFEPETKPGDLAGMDDPQLRMPSPETLKFWSTGLEEETADS
jgi:hypothetical protein